MVGNDDGRSRGGQPVGMGHAETVGGVHDRRHEDPERRPRGGVDRQTGGRGGKQPKQPEDGL